MALQASNSPIAVSALTDLPVPGRATTSCSACSYKAVAILSWHGRTPNLGLIFLASEQRHQLSVLVVVIGHVFRRHDAHIPNRSPAAGQVQSIFIGFTMGAESDAIG